MTSATRDALERVSQILRDAGWDESPPAPPELTDETLRSMRHAYENLLREDHIAIIQQTLGNGRRVEDAGQSLGMGPSEAKSLLVEALTRLCDFAEVAEDQGFAPAHQTRVTTGSGN